MTFLKTLLLVSIAFFSLLSCRGLAADWKAKLANELPLLGHRNWIVVVDSAYPLQTSPGVETIATGASQIEVVQAVLAALQKTKHVRPIIYTDSELKDVPEKYAAGIGEYRQKLSAVLGSRSIQTLPHEQLITKLDDAGKTFHILILKTTLTLPYTSVFFQLQCGYWSDEAEAYLRSLHPRTKEAQH